MLLFCGLTAASTQGRLLEAVELALEMKDVGVVHQVLAYVESPSAFVMDCDEVMTIQIYSIF